ncbi:MAG TPA: SRPBCC domain-containing protein [Candidatus Bathyarchaeia archaeon]|nr:SRPBCC domain-containing protein [Candidatus Bathyarchaeia archaeon]
MDEASGILGRVVRKEVKVNAPIEKVWNAWTTNEGAMKFFAPKAIIELTPGGRYELYFDLEASKGSRGGEGCRVLSFLPMVMLSFEWNAPPEFPNVRKEQKQKHTWVVVQFYPIARDQTKVRLTHLGWKEGEEWEKVFQYFMRAWDIVLGRLEHMFSTGKPIDWENPYSPPKNRTYSV